MGEPGKMTIYRPSIKASDVFTSIKVTYRYNNKYETAIFTPRKTAPQESVALDFARGFREYAFKNKNVNKGNITREDALIILQNIVKNNHNSYIGTNGGESGALSEAKIIFDIYTDKDSHGGEMLTQKEQSEILHQYATKYGSIQKDN